MWLFGISVYTLLFSFNNLDYLEKKIVVRLRHWYFSLYIIIWNIWTFWGYFTFVVCNVCSCLLKSNIYYGFGEHFVFWKMNNFYLKNWFHYGDESGIGIHESIWEWGWGFIKVAFWDEEGKNGFCPASLACLISCYVMCYLVNLLNHNPSLILFL